MGSPGKDFLYDGLKREAFWEIKGTGGGLFPAPGWNTK